MRGRAPVLALLIALAAVAFASAQENWAVQVVALRDYREAQSAGSQLSSLGFPAYLEFAMDRGQQFVRVRVGCFETRDAADAMAQAMRGRVTNEAQAVELGPGSLAPGCEEEAIGFLNGYDWQIVEDEGPVAFGVLVAGVPATVVHDGDRWRMVQEDGTMPPLNAAATDARFSEISVGGSTFAVVESGGSTTVVCPGELLAHVGDFAIVARGDVVVACRWKAAGSQ